MCVNVSIRPRHLGAPSKAMDPRMGVLQCSTSGVGIRRSVCPSICVKRRKGSCVRAWVGGQIVFGAELLRVGLNEVIARPLSICYRGSSNDQGVAMASWTQKGVAWEQVQGL